MQHAVRESASDSFSLLAWTAIGRGLLLVVDCYWSWTAIGRGLLLVVDCYWLWTAIGRELLLVVDCYWSWTTIGRGVHRHQSTSAHAEALYLAVLTRETRHTLLIGGLSFPPRHLL